MIYIILIWSVDVVVSCNCRLVENSNPDTTLHSFEKELHIIVFLWISFAISKTESLVVWGCFGLFGNPWDNLYWIPFHISSEISFQKAFNAVGEIMDILQGTSGTVRGKTRTSLRTDKEIALTSGAGAYKSSRITFCADNGLSFKHFSL